MEQSDFDTMTPFDKLISSRQLQMIKLLIPYTPPANQRTLAIYAKFLELEHTIDFFRHFNSDIHSQAFDKKITSPADILDEIRPYLPEHERNTMDSIMNIFSVMQMASAMDNANPMDMMKEMLTPEQQSMFEMYNTMFTETENPDRKGESENE